MFKKIILILIIFQITFEQNSPKVQIKSIKDPNCSNEMGRIDYTAKINYSDLPDENSYFLLFLKDSDGLKRPSICKLNKQGVSPSPEPNTDNVNTETPVNSDNPNTESPGPINPDHSDGPINTEVTDNTNVPVPIITQAPIPDEKPISLDDLKKLLDKLRKNFEDGLNETVTDIDNLDDVNYDLKDIISFNIMLLIKKVHSDMNDLENALNKIQDEQFVQPLNLKLTELINELDKFEPAEFAKLINETMCAVRLDVVDAIEKKYKTLKKFLEDLQDIIDKISFEDNTDEDIDVDIDEDIELFNCLKSKLLELIDKLNNFKIGMDPQDILNLINDIKQKIIDYINNDVNKPLSEITNKFFKSLLYLNSNIKEIEEVIRANGTVIDIGDKVIEKLNDTIEKIEAQIKNMFLKPLIEKISKIKNDILEDLNDLLIINTIKEKKEELEDYFKDLNEEAAKEIEGIIYNLTNLDQDEIKEFIANIDEMTPQEILEELKKLFKIDEAFQKLKDAISTEDFDELDDKTKDLLVDLLDKINDAKDSPLKYILEKIAGFDEYLKVTVNGTQLEDALIKLNKILTDLSFLEIDGLDKVNDTFYAIIDAFNNLNLEALFKKITETPYTEELLDGLKKKFIDEPIEKLTELLNKLDDKIAAIASIPKELKDNLKKHIKYLKENLEDLKTNIKDELEKIKEEIKKKIDESGIAEAFDKYNESLIDLFNTIKDDLDDINLEEQFNLLKEKLKNINQNIIDAIKNIANNATSNFPNLQDKLKELFNYLQDEFKNFTDQKKEAFEKLINDIKKGIKELTNNTNGNITLLDFFDIIKEGIKSAQKQLDEKLAKFNESDAYDKARELIYSLGGLYSTIIQILGDPGKRLDSFLNQLIAGIRAQEPYLNEDLLTNVTKVIEGIEKFRDYFKNVSLIDKDKLNETLVKEFAKLLEQTDELIEKYPQLANISKALIEEFSKPVYKDLLTNITNIDEKMTEFLKSTYDWIESLNLDDEIKKQYNNTKEKLENLTKTIKATITNYFSKLSNFSGTIINDLKEYYPEMYINGSYIIGLIAEGINDLKDFINNLTERIPSYIEQIKNPFKDNFNFDFKEIENSNIVNAIKLHLNALKELKDTLNDLFEDTNSYTKDKLYEVINKIKNFVESDILEKIANLNGLTDSVREKIKELIDIESKINKIKEKIEEGKEDLKEDLEELKELLDGSKFLEAIGDKINGISEIISEAQIKPTILDHIMAIKNVINSINESVSKQNQKIINTLYEIRDGILDIDFAPLIRKLNSSIFNIKDEFIDSLLDIVKMEDLSDSIQSFIDQVKENIDNFNNMTLKDLLDGLDNMIDRIGNSSLINPIKTKIIEKMNELKEELDKFKKRIIDNDLYKKVKEYVDEAKKFLELVKEDINDNDFITFQEIIENLEKTFTKDNFEERFEYFLENLKVCNYEFLSKLSIFENIKYTKNRIKNAFNNLRTKQYIEEKIEDQIEEIEENIEKLKSTLKGTFEDERIISISVLVKTLLDKVNDFEDTSDIFTVYKIFKNLLEYNKEKLNRIQNKIQNFTIDNFIYGLNEKVKEFDYHGELKKLNDTKNKIMEVWNDYVQLESILERVEFLHESRKEFAKESIEKNSEELQDLMKKINEDLDEEKLKEILDIIEKEKENRIALVDNNLLNRLIEDLIEKGKEIKKKIDDFPTKNQEEIYQEALDDLSEHLKKVDFPFILKRIDKSIKRHIDSLNLTYYILKGIGEHYENGELFEIPNNLTELLKDELEEFTKNSKEILDDSEFLDDLNNEELSEILEKIKEDIENVEKNIKEYLDEYSDKTAYDVLIDLKEYIENYLNKTRSERLEKIKEAFKKVNDRIKEFINKEELEKMINDSQLLPEIKDLFMNIINNVKSMEENLKNNNSLSDIFDLVLDNLKSLDRIGIIDTIKKINDANIDVEKEIENAKRLKELAEEMKEIYDSSELIGLLEDLFITKTRVLEMKKQKKIKKVSKKLKNNRKLDAESEINCKIDQYFPKETKLTAQVQNLSSYLLNIDNYDLSLQEEKDISIQSDDETNCNSNLISNAKSHLIFINHTDFEIEEDKKRFTYNLNARQIGDFNYPDFFYLVVRTKLNKANGDSEEVDSYCLLVDNSDVNDVKLKCYGYTDNITSIDSSNGNAIDSLSSNYITISNSTDSGDVETQTIDTTPNNTVFFRNYYRKGASSGLKAGAIVAIVLACLAVLAAVIIVLALINRKKVAAPLEGGISESRNNLHIPPSFTSNGIPYVANVQQPVQVGNVVPAGEVVNAGRVVATGAVGAAENAI